MRRNTISITLKSIYGSIAAALLAWLISSCGAGVDKTKMARTKIKFIDSVRHYYPLPQGKELTIPYKFINVGKNPLTIIDVQTSCGCTVAEFPERPIAPESEGMITLTFQSTKNIGYTEVFTTVVSNAEPEGFHTLVFDLNVVPDALYTKDYEEIYTEQEQEKRKAGIEDLVDGDDTEEGYYTDSNKHLME